MKITPYDSYPSKNTPLENYPKRIVTYDSPNFPLP